MPYELLRKFSPLCLRVLPRTIKNDQEARLRELTEKAGKKLSELLREAFEEYFKVYLEYEGLKSPADFKTKTIVF